MVTVSVSCIQGPAFSTHAILVLHFLIPHFPVVHFRSLKLDIIGPAFSSTAVSLLPLPHGSFTNLQYAAVAQTVTVVFTAKLFLQQHNISV